MISTKGIELPESKYPTNIEPGIHEVTVTTVGGGKTPNDVTFIEISTQNKLGDVNKTSYYFKEGMNAKISTESLVQLVTACGVRNEVDAIVAKDHEDYCYKLSTVLVGKSFRGKFNGEEVPRKDGDGVYMRVSLGSGLFAEALDSPSKLRFSPEKNIKKLPTSKATASVTEDSPF